MSLVFNLLIQIICILLLIPAFLVCVYYWFLALYALLLKPKRGLIEQEPAHTFAIVIPAHNEEDVLYETLKSCSKLDYPKDKYKVFVIADNCSDRTAEIATANGVICYERHDDVNIGKGFALSWAFERILPKNHDGFFVIDADCSVDAYALRVFDQYFKYGDRVLQANDVASNPDASPMSYAVSVGNVIENDLFYAPKSQLGLAVFLRGTGMVFHRDLLLQFPWGAHSIVEDVEYTLDLLRHAVSVKFVQNIKVRSTFPVTQEQLNVQRTRWASGNLSFGKKQAVKLLIEGVLQRSPTVMDAGFTLLVLSRPLVIAELFTVFAFSGANWLIYGTLFSAVCFGLAVCLLVSIGIYFGLGILFLGLNWHRLYLLLSTPFVVIRLIFIAIINVFEIKGKSWEKTPR